MRDNKLLKEENQQIKTEINATQDRIEIIEKERSGDRFKNG